MGRQIYYKVRVCENCGREFQPKSSNQAWCEKCLTKRCLYCGNDFSIGKKTRINSAKFCSVECRGRYASEHYVGTEAPRYENGNRTKREFVCANCGRVAFKDKKQLELWEHSFCSRQCQIEFYKKPENKVCGTDSPKYSQVEVRCEWCGKLFYTYQCLKHKARFCSKKCRNDWQSDMMKGSRHPNWKGGKTEQRALDMISREYKAWRKAVFERDHYTCQRCGDNKGGNLRAHHIKPYSDFPELRHEVSNGITLCETCHIKVHSIS